MGCGGGWTENAYEYVESAGGMCSESDYPYTSDKTLKAGSCKYDASKGITGVNTYYRTYGTAANLAAL